MKRGLSQMLLKIIILLPSFRRMISRGDFVVSITTAEFRCLEKKAVMLTNMHHHARICIRVSCLRRSTSIVKPSCWTELTDEVLPSAVICDCVVQLIKIRFDLTHSMSWFNSIASPLSQIPASHHGNIVYRGMRNSVLILSRKVSPLLNAPYRMSAYKQ